VFVGGVRLGVWGVVLVACVCVSVSGVLFSVGVCVCVCDLLIGLPVIVFLDASQPPGLLGLLGRALRACRRR